MCVGGGQHCSLDNEDMKTTIKPKVGGAKQQNAVCNTLDHEGNRFAVQNAEHKIKDKIRTKDKDNMYFCHS